MTETRNWISPDEQRLPHARGGEPSEKGLIVSCVVAFPTRGGVTGGPETRTGRRGRLPHAREGEPIAASPKRGDVPDSTKIEKTIRERCSP